MSKYPKISVTLVNYSVFAGEEALKIHVGEGTGFSFKNPDDAERLKLLIEAAASLLENSKLVLETVKAYGISSERGFEELRAAIAHAESFDEEKTRKKEE